MGVLPRSTGVFPRFHLVEVGVAFIHSVDEYHLRPRLGIRATGDFPEWIKDESLQLLVQTLFEDDRVFLYRRQDLLFQPIDRLVLDELIRQCRYQQPLRLPVWGSRRRREVEGGSERTVFLAYVGNSACNCRLARTCWTGDV